jgi:hypothetical protein
MASLTDLFNPTFLMFLGILVLVVALLVVYFESKMREQNHIINSMLSLVSTLADDMNGVKMGLNHLAIRGGQHSDISIRENLGNSEINKLIDVSDDEEEEQCENDDEESNDTENNDLESAYDDSESADDDSESANGDSESANGDLESIEDDLESVNGDIKIIKLQVTNEDLNEDNDSNNLDFDNEELSDLLNEDLNEANNINDEISKLHYENEDLEPEINNEYVEEVLCLKYDDEVKQLKETNLLLSSDLKTISINLGEEHQQYDDNIDYKKMQLAKLRSIVVEKGFTNNSEASKLKKPELLKLLGVE